MKKDPVKMLSVAESQKKLEKFKVKFAKSKTAKTAAEAAKLSRQIGFPVAMKIISPDIMHKTEAGCIETNIKSETQASKVFRQIVSNALKANKSAKIHGVLIQEHVNGQEVIIGGKKDVQFGPVVLFGLGGIFVEAIKDYSIRIAPVTPAEAKEMIEEIRGRKLLEGMRGKEPANKNALKKLIVSVGKFISSEENFLELDLNPVIVNSKEAVVVDARIIYSS
ncbi:MAG: acetate--CoA ligase family protein [Candidatus Diapherotrites archaeon]|nr:acetate--CoA ligase family protein [Candidatus Diapherotrites archaeon]